MMKLTPVVHAALGLVIGSTAVASPTTRIETPQQAAAAYVTMIATERNLAWATQLMSGYARIYAHEMSSAAASMGAVPLSGSISVACPEGGSMVLTGNVGVRYVLTASYQDCAADNTGLHAVRNGQVTATYVRRFDFISPYKLVGVQFGSAAGKFTESRQFLPLRPDQLDPSLSTLSYRITGELLDLDAPVDGDYFYTLTGTFAEESTYLYYASQITTIKQYFLLDSDDMQVKGRNFQDVTATGDHVQYSSGQVSYTFTTDTPPVPNEESFIWKVDNFRTTGDTRNSTGEFLRSFDGGLDVTLPVSYTNPQGCHSGNFRFHTPESVEEISAGTSTFTDGTVLINGSAKIQFNASEPVVTVKVPGEVVATYGYDGLTEIGNCYL
jgi:hypothetical protein